MVSPSHLKASSATKKTASPPSIDSSSEQPAASNSPVSTYRLGTAAMMLPNLNATVEASGNDATPSTPPARVLPEHILSSEDNNHENSDSAHSSFSTTHVNGSNHSDSASSSVPAINSNGVPLRPKAKAPKKTPGKRLRPDSNVSSASSSGGAAVPAKKRVRSNALMRSAPRATIAVTPGSLAGNSDFMYVYTSPLLKININMRLNQAQELHRHHLHHPARPRWPTVPRSRVNPQALAQADRGDR